MHMFLRKGLGLVDNKEDSIYKDMNIFGWKDEEKAKHLYPGKIALTK